MDSNISLLISLTFLASLDTGCRAPPLPPTEPPHVSDEAAPGTRTNDAPTLGPLAGDDVIAASGTGSGGSSILPKPPAPGGSSGSGFGGSASSDTR
jgi:hypothetical protein